MTALKQSCPCQCRQLNRHECAAVKVWGWLQSCCWGGMSGQGSAGEARSSDNRVANSDLEWDEVRSPLPFSFPIWWFAASGGSNQVADKCLTRHSKAANLPEDRKKRLCLHWSGYFSRQNTNHCTEFLLVSGWLLMRYHSVCNSHSCTLWWLDGNHKCLTKVSRSQDDVNVRSCLAVQVAEQAWMCSSKSPRVTPKVAWKGRIAQVKWGAVRAGWRSSEPEWSEERSLLCI